MKETMSQQHPWESFCEGVEGVKEINQIEIRLSSVREGMVNLVKDPRLYSSFFLLNNTDLEKGIDPETIKWSVAVFAGLIAGFVEHKQNPENWKQILGSTFAGGAIGLFASDLVLDLDEIKNNPFWQIVDRLSILGIYEGGRLILGNLSERVEGRKEKRAQKQANNENFTRLHELIQLGINNDPEALRILDNRFGTKQRKIMLKNLKEMRPEERLAWEKENFVGKNSDREN